MTTLPAYMAKKRGQFASITTQHLNRGVAGPLTATGTTRADALQLTADFSYLGTAASGTGVIAPAALPGAQCRIANGGAAAAKIYGKGTDTIDGVAAATGITLTNAKRADLICIISGAWLSSGSVAAT